ncbi:hypothetical protein RJ639_013755 [Escallonia herrerae]|uniref:Dirigent protein n=1 Tax=Escallonia herrerae TaxID=1293975 RepID=A0AA89ARJ9_9ASTE|nr:hypothetical protein RJ639_013755 [Escallonia herrerae]
MEKLTTVLVAFTMIAAFRVTRGKSGGQNPNYCACGASQDDGFITHLIREVNMMDDPLTVGPEITSELVGRAHGFYASSSQEEIGYHCAINFVFGVESTMVALYQF